jgi:hypothetical protein
MLLLVEGISSEIFCFSFRILCMYVCMYVCMHACMYVCICVRTCVCVCVYVCMAVYARVCAHACMRVCVCACVCAYVYINNIQVHNFNEYLCKHNIREGKNACRYWDSNLQT